MSNALCARYLASGIQKRREGEGHRQQSDPLPARHYEHGVTYGTISFRHILASTAIHLNDDVHSKAVTASPTETVYSRFLNRFLIAQINLVAGSSVEYT
eukprot:scaffold2936_cov113-Cylindrotheca_fusiformis.AAC.14